MPIDAEKVIADLNLVQLDKDQFARVTDQIAALVKEFHAEVGITLSHRDGARLTITITPWSDE